MSWISNQYDRRARGFTLGRAIFYLVVFVFLCFWGVVQMTGSPLAFIHVDLKWGIVFSVFGVVGVLHCIETVRAVVRRRRVESRGVL